MKKTLLTVAALSALAVTSGNALAQDAAKLAKSKNCMACHSIDKKVLGPSFQAVAKKYAGQAGAEALVAGKITNGSQGIWGSIPMPPNPVSPAEAKELAAWVLSQK